MISKVFKLSNNLPVVIVDTESFPSVTTMLLVGTGSRFENSKNNGISHFLEHIVFKGSKNFPSAHAISSTIEGMGGEFNAFTGKEHTGYWVKSPIKYFTNVIDVISDMVLRPLLCREDIEREKKVIIEEINMYEDQPARKVGEIFERTMFKGDPLSYDVAGTKNTVSDLNRKMIELYSKEYYVPQNAVLVVAGGLRNDSSRHTFNWYLNELESTFGFWRGKKKSQLKSFTSTQKTPFVTIEEKDTEQVHFTLGYTTFGSSDSRKYILSLLSVILGGGMSSRLFSELREKRGLCYYISTGRDLYKDTGYIATQAGVTKDIKKVNEAVNLIMVEQNEIVRGKLSDEEIRKAKELIKGRFLLSLEDSHVVAGINANKYLEEAKVLVPSDVIERVEKITKKELTDLAKELFRPERMTLSAIGPIKKGTIVI